MGKTLVDATTERKQLRTPANYLKELKRLQYLREVLVNAEPDDACNKLSGRDQYHGAQ